jgi:hypothetical protein
VIESTQKETEVKANSVTMLSRTMVAATFACAVVVVALGVQRDARSDSVSRAPLGAAAPKKDCLECYEHPPLLHAGFELPKNMKAAEPIDTF